MAADAPPPGDSPPGASGNTPPPPGVAPPAGPAPAPTTPLGSPPPGAGRRWGRRRGDQRATGQDVVSRAGAPQAADRHLTLADLPPAVADKVGFDEAAPRRLRGDRLPAEVRDVFREVWDEVVADVYQEVAGRSRRDLFSKEVITQILQKVAWRIQRAERALIVAGVYAPLPGDRDWTHIGAGGVGGGAGAAAEEVAAYLSMGTGATIAVTSAIVAELFETYVAASARTRQYQRAGRVPDPELIATDLAESVGFAGSVGRRTSSDMTKAALTWLAHEVVGRTSKRFARGLLPVAGIALNAGTSGRNIHRVTREPLRPLSEQEVGREVWQLLVEKEGWEAARTRFERLQGLDPGDPNAPTP